MHDLQDLLAAIKFADRKHKGQVRKVSGAPYVSHTVAVSYIVAAFKQSRRLKEILMAAVLHDILEDTNTKPEELVKRFGLFVASLVQEVTNDAEEVARLGKFEYQARKMVGMSSYGLVLKLADRIHNISDHPTSKMVEDTLNIIARLRAGRKLTKTHKAMIAELERLCLAARKPVAIAA